MRRHVFYIHGFDPRGPAPYHAICTAAARRRKMATSPRRKASPISSEWEIEAPAGAVVYEVLRYDDLVRELWPRWSGVRRYWAALCVVVAFARAGVLGRLARHARPTYWAVLLQGFVGLAPFAFALALGAFAFAFASRWLASPWALAIAGLVAVVAAPICRKWEARLNLAWYTRSLSYILETATGEIQAPKWRTNAFAQRIVEIWRRGEADEIVVVGHSLGATIAVMTLARALQIEPAVVGSGPRIVFLTLGQAVPIYGQLDATGDFSRDTACVARAFRWVDVTSPYDSASAGSMPILDDAPETLVSLRTDHIDAGSTRLSRIWRPLEFHFQYLRAADPERGFDYLTALCAEAPFSPSETSSTSLSRNALAPV